LTQEELARRVGCAVGTIKKIETDARRPSRQLAELLANELNIAPDDRAIFIQAARAERSPERLPLSDQLVAPPPRMALPAFLTSPTKEPARERARFVTRARELAALGARLNAALQGNGQVVFTTGEAGRGKTALMAEFARRAQATHPSLIVASGNCNAISGVGDPYLPFRDVLSMLCGDVQSRWVAGAITQEHARRLWTLMPVTTQALVENGPDLLDIFVAGDALVRRVTMSVEGNTAWLEQLHALTARDRASYRDLRQASLFEEYTNVLRVLAEQHPLLLLIDDLQWADDASINLLFHVGRRLAGTRVLIVGAYRDSEVELGRPGMDPAIERIHPLKPLIHEFTRSFGDIQIDLNEITAAEGRAFVDTLLDAEPNQLGESFRSSLFERTQGHPLFTVELLRDLQARGALTRDEAGHWTQGAPLDWSTLPTRVEAVIAQRVERLDNELREILTVASVEGEGFSAQVVARALEREEWAILRPLSQELRQRHHLVRDRDQVTVGEQRLARYWFSHVLFQQYLYQQLSPGERRVLHGKVAGALHELYRGGLEEITAQLAHHYAEAGNRDEAVNYLLQAGDRARTLYAHQEALDHYQHALGLLKEMGDEERAARTLIKLGLTYNIAFDFERARRAYEEGLQLWQRVETKRPASSDETASHTLRLNWRDPDTLDPAMPLTIWTVSMIGQFFSGLVRITPEMDVAPEMAHSWDEVDGGHRYIFHLRQDARWSDGTRVTASDFEYAWKRILDPATGAAFPALLLHDIRGARAFHQGATTDPDSIGVRAQDDSTLVVELEVPAPYFIQLLAFPTTYPAPRWAIEKHGDAWTEPGNIVTNGPYILDAWEHNQKMILKRNPRYHSTWGNVPRVELILEGEPDELLALYGADALDLLNLWFLPPAIMDRARQQHAEDYVAGPQLLTYYLTFNVTRPPFDDLRVRRAFALATDKERFADVDMRGNFYPATGGFVPPGMPGHVAGIAPRTDVEMARQLLAEAGYSVGSPGMEGCSFPEIEILTRPGREFLCQPLIAQWRQGLGVTLTVKELPSPELEERMQAAPPHMFLHLWIADYPDPDCYLRVCVQDDQKTFGWHNTLYDQLIERARRITDQQERMQLYRRAEQILVQEMPMLVTTYGQVHVLLKPWLKNYRMARMKQQFWQEIVIEDK
jgi:ABC-type oligopeptide transport system substrate-binding subunit/transcriptional regulator with XRE-family HTH domain